MAVGSAGSQAHIDPASGCCRLEVAGSLELGSLAALPPQATALSASGPSLLLPTSPFPSLRLSPRLVFLPRRRRLGDRRRHSSRLHPALCRRRASTRYGRPFSFLLLCETEHPQTLTKLFVFGSESSYITLPTNFDFVCKNYRVCWVRPCHQFSTNCSFFSRTVGHKLTLSELQTTEGWISMRYWSRLEKEHLVLHCW